MRKIFFLLLLVFFPLMVSADAIEINGIYYNLNAEDKTAEVTQNPNKYSGDVTIPDKVIYSGLEYNVTSIGESAFRYCWNMTSISIPNSVTSIGWYAFSDCRGLTSVNIPNSVTSIDSGAFHGCYGLTSIVIPKSVTSMGVFGAFTFCNGLASIIVDADNPKYDSRDNCNAIIDKESNVLISGCKNTIIPNGVTSIGFGAFHGCYGLTSITIPNSVTTLEYEAFSWCIGLTSIEIPKSVTKINERAVSNCTGITSITIPNTVKSIGGDLFSSCSNLTTVIVEDGNEFYDSRNNCNAIIEKSTNKLIAGCKTTTIPNTVTSIGYNSMCGFGELTSLTIPNSVTSIDFGAFQSCGFTSITIPTSVKSIGNCAFGYCSNLKDVYCLAEKVPVADAGAFSGGSEQSHLDKMTLHVPAGSVEAYKSTEPWNQFKEIKAIEDPNEFSLNFMGQIINDGATLYINAEGWSALGNIYTDPDGNTKNGLFVFVNKGGKVSGSYSLEILSNTLNGDLKWSMGGETYALNEVSKLEKSFSTDDNGIASVEFSAENIPNEGSLDAKLIVTIGEKTKTFYIKINFKKKDSPDLTVSGKVGEPVDLGLSVKWASWNVGAGAPEEYGNHYAWGELEPKTDYSSYTYKFYNNGYTKYGSIDNKYELDEADDVARQKWGEDWRMPTFDELKELYEKCSFSNETYNGVPVTKVTGPNGNYIYMPGPGNFTGQTLYFKNSVGSYWSRNLETDSYAKDLDFFSSYRSLNGDTRYHGQSVRPVYAKIVSGKAGEPVDLGLTSGTLWSSCNIGASTPEEYGSYFAWGETAPKSNYDWSTYKFGGGSNFTKYNSSDGLTELALEDDAAYVLWGENWRMPTHQQELELVNECTRESVTLNGISGYKFTGPNGNSIFMPRGGLYDGTDYDADGTKVSYANTRGWYWSSTLNAIGSSYAQGLCFFPSLLSNVSDHERCDGHNIRPVYVGGLSKRIVHVAEAGSLPTLISDAEKYLIHELVLTGEINGTDWRLIRDMAGCNYQGKLTNGNLEILDLSDVRIVPGGLNYLDADDGLPNLGGRFHYAIVNADELSQYILHGCNRLVNILLPKSLKTICYGAFNCRNLRNVTIPNGVNSIGFYAFRGCRSLPSITIPASVSSIGNYTFDHCISLTSILVDADNQYFTSIDGVLFNKDVTVIRRYPEGKTENSYTLPETITTLAETSFNNCVNLIDIKFPKNLKTIEPWAFGSCTGLKSFVIPDEVETVGVYAFWDCDNLESIVIPAQMKQIDICAFQSCDKLKSVISYMPDPIAMGVYDPWSKEYATVESVFDSEAFNTAILAVPYGKTEVYKSAEGWNNFKNVVEMGETAPITIGKSGKASYCGDKSLDFSGSEEIKAYVATGFDKDEGTIWLTRVKDVPAGVPVLIKGDANKTYDVPVTDSENSYYTNMFVGNTTGETVQVGETDGDKVNYYLSGDGTFKSVNKSVNIGNNKSYLQLPGSFNPAVAGATQTVTIKSSGKASYAAPLDLDFTNVEGLKAFSATGYDKSSKTIWLTRVMKVQKGEGVLLKGDAKDYEIPSAAVQSSYMNMFVGNTSGDKIQVQEKSEDGSQTNFYLNGDGAFVSVNGFVNIGNNKCYLELPTLMVSGSASTRGAEANYILEEPEMIKMPISFRSLDNDGDGTTAIKNLTPALSEGEGAWYTLQGQRVMNPGKGLYIKNGKKVIVR